jgi:large subunit ribosomal protein L31e
MAENKKSNENVYTVPLRRFWLNVPKYKRSRKAVIALKKYIARHMKVVDRDLDKVKLDVYLNNEIWFRGRAKPPAKVKVKAVKDGDNVKVSFFETPKEIKFLKLKHSKLHKKVEKVTPVKEEEKKEGKTEEEKKDESEKEKAVEQQNIQQAEVAAKVDKHSSPIKEPKINRMALKK